MPSKRYDLGFLRAGVPELETYLLSKEVYWPIGGKTLPGDPPYPMLTLGWILLSLKRSKARESEYTTPGILETLDDLAKKIEKIRAQWKVAWESKAQDEFSARLKLWTNFINEYRQKPGEHANRFIYEVQRRVIIDLLEVEAGDIANTERELLNGLDKYLKEVLQSGEFVWEKEIAVGFPREKFWYLYGDLRN